MRNYHNGAPDRIPERYIDDPVVRAKIYGGTIVSELDENERLVPFPGRGIPLFTKYAPSFLSRVPTTEVPKPQDSSRMLFPDYMRIFQEEVIPARRDGVTNYIQIQGTDTITEGAIEAALRFFLQDFGYIFVGSQHPIWRKEAIDYDAENNLEVTYQVASLGWPGTWVVGNNGEILIATRAMKVRPNKAKSHPSKYEEETVPNVQFLQSFRYPIVARLTPDGLRYTERGGKAHRMFLQRVRERDDLRNALKQIYGDPIFLPFDLPQQEDVEVYDVDIYFDVRKMAEDFERGVRAAILRLPGTGGVPVDALKNEIERWKENGRPMGVQSRHEAIPDDSYAVNLWREAGAFSLGDMPLTFAKPKMRIGTAIGILTDDPVRHCKEFVRYPVQEELRESILPVQKRTTDGQIYTLLSKVASKIQAQEKEVKLQNNGQNGTRRVSTLASRVSSIFI